MKKKNIFLAITFLFSFLSYSFTNNNPPLVYPDADGDGFYSNQSVSISTLDPSIPYQSTIGNDCHDDDYDYHPGAVYYRDFDADGFGDPLVSITITYCENVTGYILYTVGDLTDCNDTDSSLNPYTTWYYDGDNDGYGSTTTFSSPQCNKPAGLYVLNNTDCNDSNVSVHIVQNWYPDIDNDGYGNGVSISSCVMPQTGYVSNNLDTTPTTPGPIQGNIVPSQTAVYCNDKNYIITSIPKIPALNLQSISNSKDISISITYFDDLGRPIQKIANQQSGSGKNIITPIEYDPFGNQTKDYLPYATTGIGLEYVSTALTDQPNFPQYSGQISFSDKLFEASPLNRVLEQAAPGNDWSLTNATKHTIRLDYQTNTATEVKYYSANADGTNYATLGYYNPSLTDNGTYAVNQLFKNKTKNENWVTTDGNNNTTEEFKDKEGHLVLKRTYGESLVNGVSTNVAHDTYYVYDTYGNLTYVIPPLVDTNSTITTAVLDGLCYQYRYDYRNRLVEKKLPSKQWEFIIYDKLDRVVATGPVLSPFTNSAANTYGWQLTKYDVYNRPVLTAWMPSTTVTSSGRKTFQDGYNGTSVVLSESKLTSNPTTINGIVYLYSNLAYPAVTTFHILSINYYDDYNTNLVFNPAISYSSSVSPQPVYYNNSTGKLPIGLQTVSWVRILEGMTDYNAEKSYTLYDNKSRAVRTFTNNSLGGFTQIDSQMEAITGRVNYTLTTHKRDNTSTLLTVRDDYTYTDQDRLLRQTHTVNGGTPQLIAENTYNELGQIISKKVGNTSSAPLQKVDYSYNIRGWLTDVNNVNNLYTTTENDLFAYKINYNSVVNAPNANCKSLYNGNISETYWITKNDNTLRKYNYEYDNLNRLRNSIYQKPNAATTLTNSYNESMQYDKNGNILNLQRNGNYDDPVYNLQIDNLSYFYDTSLSNLNRLMKVTDLSNDPTGFKDDSNGSNDIADDYSYDANGNMVTDQNKGITSIKYNIFNLPTEIIFSNNSTKKINYIYNAVGVKIKKIVTNGTVVSTTDYLNGFQYYKATSAAVAALKYIPTAEGYVSVTTSGTTNSYNYVFTYKDHLGNVRVSYGFGPTSTNPNPATYILQESNYYPFGLQHSNYNMNKLTYDDNIANGIGGTIVIPPLNYQMNKYKYNGKELQDELGLNMYSMDMRQYDPAIGRWIVQDPLVHLSVTPYGAFENNPVFWADPSGASVEKDDRPVSRFRHWSDAVRGVDRGEDDDKLLDIAASKSLKATAKLYFDGENVSNLKESDKQKIFKESSIKTIGILLWEFASGTGKNVRDFNYNEHPFANEYVNSRINEIIFYSNENFKKMGYETKDGIIWNTEKYEIGLPFSPTKSPSTWGNASAHIITSNAVCQFIGGAVATLQINNGVLSGTITNETSRNSLFVHLGENYIRRNENGNNPILSTIKQEIHFSATIIK